LYIYFRIMQRSLCSIVFSFGGGMQGRKEERAKKGRDQKCSGTIKIVHTNHVQKYPGKAASP